MKKGIVVIYVPVGNCSDKKKLKKHIDFVLLPLGEAIEQIRRSGFIVLIFPSFVRKDFSLEVTYFGR